MKLPYPSSRFIPGQRKGNLSRSWFFRLSSLAFISLATPFLGVTLHGFVFVIPVLMLAIFAGFLERSFNQVLWTILKGISHNKLLFYLVIWYVTFFVLNIFLYGKGLTDWKLLLSPFLILIAFIYAFAFMNNNLSYRYFQIAFIIVSGVQSIFSAKVLYSTVDIAREAILLTSGAWIYGNQTIYALYAVIFPLLLWRSFKESGLLRFILLVSCVFILVTCVLSSFATPVALILIGSIITLVFSVVLLRKSAKVVILLAVVIPILFIQGYRYTRNNPLFSSASIRIENFISSPESGGYLNIRGAISRWDLAKISIDTFQNAPVFGIGGPRDNNPNLGGHSSFFDNLARLGLLGGSGALCGILLILFANSFCQFWSMRNWETLLTLTCIILLIVAGIGDPYWEGILPFIIILSRPYYYKYDHVEEPAIEAMPRSSIEIKSA